MRLVFLVSLLWMPPAWAGTACFEAATGKWLGEYCEKCHPGICERNWVTNNPQLGYTADQIEERQVTALELRELMDLVDQPRQEAKALQEANRQTARDKLKEALGLTEQELDALVGD